MLVDLEKKLKIYWGTKLVSTNLTLYLAGNKTDNKIFLEESDAVEFCDGSYDFVTLKVTFPSDRSNYEKFSKYFFGVIKEIEKDVKLKKQSDKDEVFYNNFIEFLKKSPSHKAQKLYVLFSKKYRSLFFKNQFSKTTSKLFFEEVVGGKESAVTHSSFLKFISGTTEAIKISEGRYKTLGAISQFFMKDEIDADEKRLFDDFLKKVYSVESLVDLICVALTDEKAPYYKMSTGVYSENFATNIVSYDFPTELGKGVFEKVSALVKQYSVRTDLVKEAPSSLKHCFKVVLEMIIKHIENLNNAFFDNGNFFLCTKTGYYLFIDKKVMHSGS